LTIRFETPPGEQAQADWAEAGRYHLPDGTSIRVFFFVMVLGFSRALYIEFTRSMRLESLIRCHQNAFAYLGAGLPRSFTTTCVTSSSGPSMMRSLGWVRVFMA
jgi:transposase